MTINYNMVRPTDAFIVVDYYPYSKNIVLTGCLNKESIQAYKCPMYSIGVWHIKHKNQKI